MATDLRKISKIGWLSILSPPALAHSGPHLDDETLEVIFQFMDRTYQGFLTHLPLVGGIVVGLGIVLAVMRCWRHAKLTGRSQGSPRQDESDRP